MGESSGNTSALPMKKYNYVVKVGYKVGQQKKIDLWPNKF
jgi:hypothetical protein